MWYNLSSAPRERIYRRLGWQGWRELSPPRLPLLRSLGTMSASTTLPMASPWPGSGSSVQSHQHPRTVAASLGAVRAHGRFRRIAHDHRPMVQWMDEMLSQQEIMTSHQLSSDNGDKRAFFRTRAALNASCFDKLREQASAHSLRLSGLLQKLWTANEELTRDVTMEFEQQFSSSQRLKEELERLVGFSEKQLARSERQRARSERRADDLESELQKRNVQIDMLQRSLADARGEQARLEYLTEEMQQVQLKKGNFTDRNALFDRAINGAEEECRRQHKFIEDMDGLVRDLEFDLLTDRAKAGEIKTTEVACQTSPEDEIESVTTDGRPPPALPPKSKRRIGFHMPYGIRMRMKVFRKSKRTLALKTLCGLVLRALFHKVESDVNNDREKTSRRTICELTHDFLFNKYGLENLADWHATEMVFSLRHHKEEHKRVELFGRLIGAFLPGTAVEPELPARCADFVADCLGALGLSHEAGIDGGAVAVSLKSAQSMASAAFAHIDKAERAALLARIALLPKPDVSKWKRGHEDDHVDPKIDLDAVLELVVEEWVAEDTRWTERLTGAFMRFSQTFRRIYGIVLEVEKLDDVDLDDPSYFHVIDEPNLRRCLNVAGIKTDKYRASLFFEQAARLLATERTARLGREWREVKVGGGKYWFNDYSLVTAWSRPAADEQEGAEANPDVEVDLPTFIEYAKQMGWMRVVCSAQN